MKNQTARPATLSPLYTSKANEAAKLAVIKAKSKDADGAFRVSNRIDEADRAS